MIRWIRCGVLVVSVSIGAACGIPANDEARTIEPEELPRELVAPPAPTSTLADDSVTVVQLYYVREGHLAAALASLDADPALGDVIDLLGEPPIEPLAEAGFRSPLATAPTLGNVTLARGVANVDLTVGFNDLPVSDQVLALGQVVLTATARPGVGQVRFTLGGEPIEVPAADGALVTGAVSRDDYEPLVAE